MPDPEIIIVPGLGNSGPEHWQSLWQESDPQFRRAAQAEWESPLLGEWLAGLDAAVSTARGPVILVAHSLGCILSVHFAKHPAARRVAAALLVAPPDVEANARLRDRLCSFAPFPSQRLPFPATVVASQDDPYMPIGTARMLAAQWRARFVDIGRGGHINVASGHGEWPEGRALLRELAERSGTAAAIPSGPGESLGGLLHRQRGPVARTIIGL